ncbi:hypothetical protein [Aliiroseovarius marinus]|uniref:hypothetical protein n=1 Tax=Aliiroseovarius marinus TaxID=2500159 RepID=UPI003D7E8932
MGKRTEQNGGQLVFGQKALDDIYALLKADLHPALINRLDQIVQKFRPIVLAVPTHSKLGPTHIDVSKQAQWVQNSIINTAEELRDALANESHMFRGIMSPQADQLIDTSTYIPMLNKLIDEADMAFVDLDQQAALGIRNSEQLQFEIVKELWAAFSTHLGKKFHARGQKNADEAIRVAFAEVYGKGERLASLLKVMRNSS